ncbi:uncharacterized protein L969DRAFT_96365 [Mixia osmundae IAM 14324]|uniref:Uncharacterized protein n=1 Tax=Mixia osmundae (strain CBS 9802 / IAM 14324 / JCM 22182 / KY 12970) TaxID=764103 RepID=G7DWE9_MIXOS|nr:uncharacterized protein L969DRAFT_96365 [Mixia osmundae IAM 14324]KEI37278.1 hypothetical protein L969DRAFT_96365 [Mixia osmundae IAM 14324]GAA94909.1 hypothetical protein E5Q_01564 [Mixia osmundae IAM 14324]
MLHSGRLFVWPRSKHIGMGRARHVDRLGAQIRQHLPCCTRVQWLSHGIIRASVKVLLAQQAAWSAASTGLPYRIGLALLYLPKLIVFCECMTQSPWVHVRTSFVPLGLETDVKMTDGSS